MNNKRNKREFYLHTSFVDLFGLLIAFFILIIVSLAENMVNEYLAKIDLYERRMADAHIARSGVDVPTLTVVMLDEKNQSFILTSKTIGNLTFDTPSKVKTALAMYRPTQLKLRIDQRIPSGIMQALLLDAKELGIQATLSVKKKGQE